MLKCRSKLFFMAHAFSSHLLSGMTMTTKSPESGNKNRFAVQLPNSRGKTCRASLNHSMNQHRVSHVLQNSPLSPNASIVPPPTPLPSLGPAIARLSSVLSTLTTSHTATTATLATLAAERQALDEKETSLRTMVGEADAKKTWFEEMTNKTDDLGAFLDIKVGSRRFSDQRCQFSFSSRLWRVLKRSIYPISMSAMS
jgi:hypothetical protein